MCEVRCTACNALLFETERGNVIIKGKSTIELQPKARVKVKCKCGKINMITVKQEDNIYSGSISN